MRAGGCPVGHASLAELEPARRAAVASERGVADAPARPALGFDLDRTTAAQVRDWARDVGASCKDVREGLVRCVDVPAAALGALDSDGPAGELYLGFDTTGRLVDVSAMRVHVPQARIARHIEQQLASKLGAPHKRSGTFDDARLANEGASSLASLGYRYRDYFADVIALRFRSDGLVVREHYMSARD